MILKILDVGSGKGFLLNDFKEILPESKTHGIDISTYAIENTMDSVKENGKIGSAYRLEFPSRYFDLAISINALHNLYNFELWNALKEIERVRKNTNSYVLSHIEMNKKKLI